MVILKIKILTYLQENTCQTLCKFLRFDERKLIQVFEHKQLCFPQVERFSLYV